MGTERKVKLCMVWLEGLHVIITFFHVYHFADVIISYLFVFKLYLLENFAYIICPFSALK